MFFFTKQERMVITFLLVVLLGGMTFDHLRLRYPQMKDLINRIDSEDLYPKVNVNSATAEELQTIPYIGAYTSQTIIAYREEHGPFQSAADLQKVPGVRKGNYEIFKNYIAIK